MKNQQQKRTTWGDSRAFFQFAIFLIVMGGMVVLQSQALYAVLVFAILGFCAFGSGVIVWRLWKSRKNLPKAFPNRLSFLPMSWQKWILGEDEKGGRRPR